MKKKHIIAIIISIILIALIVVLAFCSKDKNNSNTENSQENIKSSSNNNSQTVPASLIFEGKITEIRDNEIELKVTDGKTTGFTSGEPIILMTENLKSDLYITLKLNDTILVEFDGIIMNSYPGRIGTIYNISLIG